MLHFARLERLAERAVGRSFLVGTKWPSIHAALDATNPSAVVVTAPARAEEMPVAATALRRGVPTFAYIHSIDNLSTKRRMLLPYDGYFVWSRAMAEELYELYPQARKVPIFDVGAAQYDLFQDKRFILSREQFLARLGIPRERRVIVYSLGSPNLINELPGAIAFSKRVEAGAFGDAHLVVRPHPAFDNGDAGHALANSQRTLVQTVASANISKDTRNQDREETIMWLNTFRHADVVVNLASTVTIDAALFDRPVISLDYDPSPGRPRQQLVQEIHRTWSHFAPLVKTGGVALAPDMASLEVAVRTYLADPAKDHAGRNAMVQLACGRVDGRAGARISEALKNFLGACSRMNCQCR